MADTCNRRPPKRRKPRSVTRRRAFELPAVRLEQLSLANCLVRDRVRLPLLVHVQAGACPSSARSSRTAGRGSPAISTTRRRCSRRRTPPPPPTRGRWPTRARRRRAWRRPLAIGLPPKSDAKRKALEDELAVKLAAAERQIATTRAQGDDQCRRNRARGGGRDRRAARAGVRPIPRPSPPRSIRSSRGKRRRMMEFDAEFFVLLGFIVFVGVLSISASIASC